MIKVYASSRCEALRLGILTVSHLLITLQEVQFNALNHRFFALPLVLSDTCHLCAKFNLSFKHSSTLFPGISETLGMRLEFVLNID